MKNSIINIRVRAILSLALLIIFIVVTFTGIGLHFSPVKGISWTFLGLNKKQLENMHTLFGFIMSALVIFHFIVNYKLFLSELKSLFMKS